MASNFNQGAYSIHDLPLPNYSLNNSLKTFHYENTCIVPENTLKNKQNLTREDDVQQIEILTSNMKDCQLHNMDRSSCKCDYVQMSPYGLVSPKSRRPNWDNDYLNNGIYTVSTPQKSPLKPTIPGTSFQFSSPIYENDLPGQLNFHLTVLIWDMNIIVRILSPCHFYEWVWFLKVLVVE